MKDLDNETQIPQASGTQQGQATLIWRVVPVSLHFNVMCGDQLVYEGASSSKEVHRMVERHNNSLVTGIEFGAAMQTLSQRRPVQRLDDLLEAATSAADWLEDQYVGSTAYERGIALRLALERLK